MNKKDIFDYENIDEKEINLEDVFFLREGEILCCTLTHECYCNVTEEIKNILEKKL
ncbi:hypothetical protein P261_02665 [Lachnospiraceae bacterium TWA4]|nr:hypothetical protein P261_02665 [Lachnospiraceae bacterium TWA4]